MTTWALISCAKTKADHPCTAREMYWPSAFFRGAWRVAEKQGQRPLILSAKYGLLLPETVIEPYDQTLQIPLNLPASVRKHWTDVLHPEWKNRVIAPLIANHVSRGDTVVTYMGGLYNALILSELRGFEGPDTDGAPGITIKEPLKGLGQGKRLAWFKQNGGAA